MLAGLWIVLSLCFSCVKTTQVSSRFEDLARSHYERALQKEAEADFFMAMAHYQDAERYFDRFDGDSLKARIISDRMHLEQSRQYHKQMGDIILQAYNQSGNTESPEIVYYMAANYYVRAGETAVADSLYNLARQINPGFDYSVPRNPDSVRDSLQRAQLSRYEKEARHSHDRSVRLSTENTQLRKTIIVEIYILAILLLLSAILVLRVQARHRLEIMRMTSIAEQTRALLLETEREKDSYKSKYISKFKEQFSLLRQIAETSLTAQKRMDGDTFLRRKIEELTKMVSDDKAGHQDFETMLDKEMDGIMAKYRKDFPNKQEKTYWLVSFLFAGFDATAISLLMDYSPESVYVIKSRIMKEIRESEADHKGLYLDLLA